MSQTLSFSYVKNVMPEEPSRVYLELKSKGDYMKNSKLLIAVSALTVAALTLTGCSNNSSNSPVAQDSAFNEFGEPSVPGEYGFGISGQTLPEVNQSGRNLAFDDRIMAGVCQSVEAFETGVYRAGGEDPKTLDRPDLISSLRLKMISMQSSLSDYPEMDIFLQGAKEKLADPGQNTSYFKMLQNTCVPYNAMLTRTIANWVEPTKVGPSGCWRSGRPKNLFAELQEKVDGEWVTIDVVSGFKKGVGGCTDKEYPYGYETEYTFWEPAEIRWRVTLLDGGRFDNGTREDLSDPITVSPGQVTAW